LVLQTETKKLPSASINPANQLSFKDSFNGFDFIPIFNLFFLLKFKTQFANCICRLRK
jgi:hypothetical protein